MSSAPPPDAGSAGTAVQPPTLFIDRDAWSRRLRDALVEAGIPFESHRDHFSPNALDDDWLPVVGRRGWIVLTRDKAIRHRPNELAAVRAAALHVFALTSGNLSAAESAEIIVKAWPHILSAVAAFAPPRLWSIDRSGRVRPIKQ